MLGSNRGSLAFNSPSACIFTAFAWVEVIILVSEVAESIFTVVVPWTEKSTISGRDCVKDIKAVSPRKNNQCFGIFLICMVDSWNTYSHS